jgi:hypothetical protein
MGIAGIGVAELFGARFRRQTGRPFRPREDALRVQMHRAGNGLHLPRRLKTPAPSRRAELLN